MSRNSFKELQKETGLRMLLNFDQMWQVIGRETTSSHRQEKKDSRRRREQGGKGLGKRKGTFRGKKKTNKKKQKTRRVRRQAMARASRRLRRQNQNTVITEDLEQTASGGVSSSCQGGEPQNRTPIAETGEAAEVAQVQANSPCSRTPQAMEARR